MIRYVLRCAEGHDFESWFQSASAFDTLAAGGHLSCPHCGSVKVEKAVMAPRVQSTRSTALAPLPSNRSEAPPQQTPATPATPAALDSSLAALRKHVEEHSEYVGKDFVDEARRMHAGVAPERSIHGEARLEEARALVEEGVPVAPLPFVPRRKAN